MKYGLRVKIAVNKIDKALLFKGDKNTFLDCTVFFDPDVTDEYGNHGGITQDISKEAREQGGKPSYIGNAKIFWRGEGQQQNYQSSQAQQHPQASQDQGGAGFDQDIPFSPKHWLEG